MVYGFKMKHSHIDNTPTCRYTNNGFTLIEIMIVVAIMGLITIAAWPSYDRYQIKNRRADGISAILEARNKIEKCYINYANATLNPGYQNTNCDPADSSNKYYNIGASTRTETEYTLTATPKGAQVDPECTVLTLTHLGVKGFTNTNTGNDPKGNLQRCWSQ